MSKCVKCSQTMTDAEARLYLTCPACRRKRCESWCRVRTFEDRYGGHTDEVPLFRESVKVAK
jgi:hypothetical protein